MDFPLLSLDVPFIAGMTSLSLPLMSHSVTSLQATITGHVFSAVCRVAYACSVARRGQVFNVMCYIPMCVQAPSKGHVAQCHL